jgi:hypothetical protein
MIYPRASTAQQIDDYHGKSVPAPFRLCERYVPVPAGTTLCSKVLILAT